LKIEIDKLVMDSNGGAML